MNALYLAIIAGVLNAFSGQILKRQPQNNEEQSGFQIVMAAFAVLLASLLVLLLVFLTAAKYQLIFIPCGLAMGLFGFVNFVTICVALRRGPMSIVWPTAWLAAPISGTIWFIITWFTDFTYWHACGIALFVLSLYCMSRTKPKTTTNSGEEQSNVVSPNEIQAYFFLHVALGMISGICNNFVFKYVSQIPNALDDVPIFTMIASANLVSCFGLYFMWKYLFKTKITLPSKSQVGRSMLNASFGICMFFLTIYGLKHADIATFMCSYAGVAISGAVMLAYFFQKEHITKPILIGIICSLIAIVSFGVGDKEVRDSQKNKITAQATIQPGKSEVPQTPLTSAQNEK